MDSFFQYYLFVFIYLQRLKEYYLVWIMDLFSGFLIAVFDHPFLLIIIHIALLISISILQIIIAVNIKHLLHHHKFIHYHFSLKYYFVSQPIHSNQDLKESFHEFF